MLTSNKESKLKQYRKLTQGKHFYHTTHAFFGLSLLNRQAIILYSSCNNLESIIKMLHENMYLSGGRGLESERDGMRMPQVH